MTKMVAYRGVEFIENHYQSGKSMGTNQQIHLDRNMLPLNLLGAYALNWWMDTNPDKLYPMFHWFGPHLMEQDHWLISCLNIVYTTQFKPYVSLYHFILASNPHIFIYYRSVKINIVQNKNVHTKMCKSTEKSKIKYYNSPTNTPLIVPEYWLNKVEEYFCLRNPGNINLSE